MKFHRTPLCFPAAVLLITSLCELTFVTAARRKQNEDSILEIMNTHEIGKLLMQRRMNHSSSSNSANDKRRYYLQNDLMDPLSEMDEDYSKPIRLSGRTNKILLSSSSNDDGHQRSLPMEEVFLPFNQSLNTASPSMPLTDERTLHSSKLLKSSKNALYVTRKEYLKKDWCKTEPLIQRIREPGCLTRTFVNRFCYGQCNSFYIPKSPKRRRNFSHVRDGGGGGGGGGGGSSLSRMHFEDEDLTAAAFQSCGFCKPKKYTWITVTLRCPSLMPQLRKKRIQKIKQCKCMAEPVR